jgi:TatD DNase family protein
VPSLGLHPVFLRTRRAGWLARLAARLAARPEAAVGEVGLDLAREGLVPVEEQEAVLGDQVGLARDLGRPLTLHGVHAWPRVIALLRAFGPHPAGIVCHAFGGPPDVIGPLAALGASFSFPASVTRHRAPRVHAAARAVPLARLLAETDAPDFAPLGADAARLERDPDGRPINVPRTLPVVVAALAAIRGEDPIVTGEATAHNARVLLAGGAGR